MFHLTDTEAALAMQSARDRSHAIREINRANAEIRRLRNALANAQAELEGERAARASAEYKLTRRN